MRNDCQIKKVVFCGQLYDFRYYNQLGKIAETANEREIKNQKKKILAYSSGLHLYRSLFRDHKFPGNCADYNKGKERHNGSNQEYVTQSVFQRMTDRIHGLLK